MNYWGILWIILGLLAAAGILYFCDPFGEADDDLVHKQTVERSERLLKHLRSKKKRN